MPGARPLPDPIVHDTPAWCFDCGYALAGLAPPARCPECGASHDVQRLVLCGMRNHTSRSPLRTALWVMLSIGAMLFSQFFVILLFAAPTLLALLGIILLVCVVAMLRTGRGEQRGTERFVFVPGKIVCKPLVPKDDRHPDDEHTIALPRDCWIHLKRVGPFWRTLRIREDHSGRVVFAGGVRCPDAVADAVEAAIRETVASSGLGEGSAVSTESG